LIEFASLGPCTSFRERTARLRQFARRFSIIYGKGQALNDLLNSVGLGFVFRQTPKHYFQCLSP
jgi:hypothetical protein